MADYRERTASNAGRRRNVFLTAGVAWSLAILPVPGALWSGLVPVAGKEPLPVEAVGASAGGCVLKPSATGTVWRAMLQSGSVSADGATRSNACNSAQEEARRNEIIMCDAGEELHVSACECVRDEDVGLWSCEARWTCVPR